MSSADRILRRSPLQTAAGMVNGSRLSALAFHGVDDPENFSWQMDYLVRHYHPVSILEVSSAVAYGRPLPSRSVLVTFDDGHRSVLEHAMPIMAERGIPGVAFVIAGLISTDEDYWWSAVEALVGAGGELASRPDESVTELVRYLKTIDNGDRLAALRELESSAGAPPARRHQLEDSELRILQSAGIDVGNHTWTHPCLNRCDAETTRREIESAHTRLADILGEPPTWFAYPNGDWSFEAEAVLSDLGYSIGFLFDHRPTDLTAEPLRLSRLRVNSDTRPDRFATILSGLHPMNHHARGRN